MNVVRNHKGRFVSVKTLIERVDRLKAVHGFAVSYAFREDAKRFGYLSSSALNGEYCGGYRVRSVTGDPSDYYGEPYVSFDGVALGDDSYGQASTVHRSNYTAIREDYPAFPWVDTSYLNVNALGCFVADLDDDMADMLVGLAEDYPVYSDDAMSALEMEEINASWPDYVAWDVRRELPEPTQSMWDALGEDTVADLWWACVSADVFGSYPEHHGTEVVWGDLGQRARDFRPYLIHAYVSHRHGGILPAAWDMVPVISRFRDFREGKRAR